MSKQPVGELMEVEYVGGGPFDGTRLFLQVVRESPTVIHVLAADYVLRPACSREQAEASASGGSDE